MQAILFHPSKGLEEQP